MSRAWYRSAVLASLLAGALPLAGCEVERGADGTRVEIDGKEAQEELERTGEQIGTAARQAGDAIQEGAERVEEEIGPVAREVLSDADITARVKAKLIGDPEVAALHIDVDTLGGRVTLNGRVANAEQKAEAQELAQETEGVTGVVNLIVVGSEPATAPPS